MAFSRAGIALLSFVRKNGSAVLLREIPEEIFIHDDEKRALRWLRDYVSEHRAFPDPTVVHRHTQIQTIQTTQPLSYYMTQARDQAVYSLATKEFEGLRAAFTDKNVAGIVEAAKKMAALERRFDLRPRNPSFPEILQMVVSDFEEAKWAGGLRGIDTGYAWLNEATGGGWQGTDNIVLAGRIGDGKSQLSLKHALSAFLSGHVVLFLSMEMEALQMARRLLGLHSQINTRDITRGRVGTYAETRLLESIQVMSNGVPFHLFAGNFVSSTGTLRALCEECVPDLIITDASYLLSPERRGSSRRENLVDVANDLKKISLDMGRPLMHTVQFNRTAVKEPRRRTRAGEQTDNQQDNGEQADPVAHLGLHKIAETDAVAANASIVLALSKLPHRDDQRYYVILKGREGERGLWKINYRFSDMNFERITEEQEQRERLAESEWMI